MSVVFKCRSEEQVQSVKITHTEPQCFVDKVSEHYSPCNGCVLSSGVERVCMHVFSPVWPGEEPAFSHLHIVSGAASLSCFISSLFLFFFSFSSSFNYTPKLHNMHTNIAIFSHVLNSVYINVCVNLSLSLSLSHTHTHTHTHAKTPAHADTHTHTQAHMHVSGSLGTFHLYIVVTH